MTYELILNQHIEKKLKQKKSIALKEVIQEESKESSYEEESESDVALISSQETQKIYKEEEVIF